MRGRPPRSPLLPYTTLFRSARQADQLACPQARTIEQLEQGKVARSEEHTSELQSHVNLVCRLLLEKKTVVLQRLQSGHTLAQRDQRHRLCLQGRAAGAELYS